MKQSILLFFIISSLIAFFGIGSMALPVSRCSKPPGSASDLIVIESKHPLSKTNPELAVILKDLDSTLQEAFKKAIGKDHTVVLEPVGYATQVVAGMNYFVKFRVVGCSIVKKGKEYVHAQIYSVPWEKKVELTAFDINKSASDPVTPF